MNKNKDIHIFPLETKWKRNKIKDINKQKKKRKLETEQVLHSIYIIKTIKLIRYWLILLGASIRDLREAWSCIPAHGLHQLGG